MNTSTPAAKHGVETVQNFSWVIPEKLAGGAQLGLFPPRILQSNTFTKDPRVADRVTEVLQKYCRAQLKSLEQKGVTAIVSTSGNNFTEDLLQEAGISLLNVPIVDGHAPTFSQLKMVETFIAEQLARTQGGVVIHCLGGHGRTGTLLAAHLMLDQPGLTAKQAIKKLRALRPKSIQTPGQVEFLCDLQARLHRHRAAPGARLPYWAVDLDHGAVGVDIQLSQLELDQKAQLFRKARDCVLRGAQPGADLEEELKREVTRRAADLPDVFQLFEKMTVGDEEDMG